MFNNYIKNNYIVLISLFWIIIWGSINTFPPDNGSIKNAFLFDENYINQFEKKHFKSSKTNHETI